MCAAALVSPTRNKGSRRRSPVRGYAPGHARKKKGAREKEDDVARDVFAEHWLVESPRRVQFERTMDVQPTKLSTSLETFYEEIVQIPEKYLTAAQRKAEDFVNYLVPRVTKLGVYHGLKIIGRKFGGSTFDSTQVVLPHEVDVFILFDRLKCRVEDLDPGYQVMPLKRYRPEKDRDGPDQFRFGRSEDGLYLSSMFVAKVFYDVVTRALKMHSHAKVEEFVVGDGSPQIIVRLKKYVFNIIPATKVDDSYLVTRPYTYDENPSSDMFWRLSFVDRERKLLDFMDLADRGVRRKAFLTLKTLVKVEHTLQGLSSYHIKTVLLHTFDSAVDNTPRWQRDTFEMAFVGLMRELLARLRARRLPHFYLSSWNLFENVGPRRLSALEGRVAFLLESRAELMRVLRKHSTVIPS